MMPPTPVPQGPRPRRRRWPWVALATAATLAAAAAGALAFAESQGWRFLARPAQQWLTQRLGRPVQLADDQGQGFSLQLWGGPRLRVDQLRIANPAWAGPGTLLAADGMQLSMRWRDALGWRPGRALLLQSLSADKLDLQLQRGADGRANWMLDTAAPGTPDKNNTQLAEMISIGQLQITSGQVQLQDKLQQLLLDARFQQQPAGVGTAGALAAQASGQYRNKPLRATLKAGSPAGWLADGQAPDAWQPFTLAVQAGRAGLDFDGAVSHLLSQPLLVGRYRVRGPSLAAVGDPLGITLPQTPRFDMRGRLVQEGTRWSTVVDAVQVGSSRLAGAFVHERRPGMRPTLTGRLGGSLLVLQDLGPAIGGATEDAAKPVRSAGRVLPDRPFDLPALRAMDARVLVDLDRLDFGSAQLQSAAPLRGRIVLADGVLQIDQIDARLAQGRLSGQVKLDGRQAPARWDVDLRGRDLRLEQWLKAVQRPGQPPWASGRLDGQVQLASSGNSTAQLLGRADGRVRLHWRNGQMSHLLVEAAGLDLAQGLGLLLTGDKQLPVLCAAADLQLNQGRATPRVLLVDTRDSLLWLDGSLSLATERLQLLAHVRPKDWSPLTLRSPLHIDGTLGSPALSLDKPQLLKRALPAALLALVHPLATLIPLMDNGDDPEAAASPAGCRALLRRGAAGFTG